jgi:hypothetical protein
MVNNAGAAADAAAPRGGIRAAWRDSKQRQAADHLALPFVPLPLGVFALKSALRPSTRACQSPRLVLYYRMRSRWLRFGLVGAAGLAAVAVLHYSHLPDDRCFSICQFRRLTGLPCPTCGVTRSLSMLAKGDWQCAVTYHPLGPLVAAVLLGGWLYLLWCAAADRPPAVPQGRTPVVILVAFLLLNVIIWIVRFVYPLMNHCTGGNG